MNSKNKKTVTVASEHEVFKSLRILLVPVLIARKRLLLFENQITKGGGSLCELKGVKLGKERPTHIVVEDSCVENAGNLETALDGLDVKDAIIISTKWLSDCIKHKKLQETSLYELKPLKRQLDHVPTIPSKRLKEAVIVDKMASQLSPLTPDVSKFICSQGSSSSVEMPVANELIVSELQKLADAFRTKGDTWRSHGYSKAISTIKRCGKEISCYEDAVSLEGIGHKIACKVHEIIETGSLRKAHEICNDRKTRILETFTKVWGVGPSTAESWFQQGCETLEDVLEKVSLNKQQKIGLKYFRDFQAKIPRKEVEEVFQIVCAVANIVEPALTATLAGSYRRGKLFCGDIDVLICKPDRLKSRDILSQIIALLKERGLITDDLVSLEENGNQRKYLGVCRLAGGDFLYRRLDIFVAPQSEYATALMHYTGSAMFNRSIRLLALKKRMSLSEHALHAGIIREGVTVLNEGYIIPTPTEESIFKALNLPFQPPQERDH